MRNETVTMSDASQIVLEEAREAWKFHTSGMVWLKWIAVGRGLQECQRLALERTHSNDMTSYAARMAMTGILEKEGLDKIDKGDRSILLKVMQALPDITAWQNTLTTTERVRYNHPRAVWGRYLKWYVKSVVAQPEVDVGEPVAPRGYKAQFAAAEAENTVLKQRLKTEGSLFNLETDTVEEIAKVLVANVAISRAERIARAVLELVKQRKAKGAHAG